MDILISLSVRMTMEIQDKPGFILVMEMEHLHIPTVRLTRTQIMSLVQVDLGQGIQMLTILILTAILMLSLLLTKLGFCCSKIKMMVRF
jgi:hypothetical protein